MAAILMSIDIFQHYFGPVSARDNVIVSGITIPQSLTVNFKSSHFQNALFALCISLAAIFPKLAVAEDGPEFGPLVHEFQLTLDSGARLEAAGPFFYDQQKGTEHTWAIPPLFSYAHDPATESTEYDFVYPLLT